MKPLFTFVLVLLFLMSKSIVAQPELVLSKKADFEFLESILFHKDHYYLLTKHYLENGNDSYARVEKLDSEFNREWAVTIEDSASSDFRKLSIHEGKLYILGSQGFVRGIKVLRPNVTLVEFSLNGKVLNKKCLIKNAYPSSEVTFRDGKLYFVATHRDDRVSLHSSLSSYNLNS
ncbi:MAG: hypothetical protein N4A46_05645, partial [Schleiferiaceae bacterium]|nr:hypothetical protein [Schleiferiaceae bacterium]